MTSSTAIVGSVATLAAAAVFLAACAGAKIVDSACTAFRPITYSASGDTEDTKRQVRGHNAAWVALCGVPQ
jgi:hypothetical protein